MPMIDVKTMMRTHRKRKITGKITKMVWQGIARAVSDTIKVPAGNPFFATGASGCGTGGGCGCG